MKKYFVFFAVAALAVVSCNKVQDRAEAAFDADEILFSAPVTRATEVNDNNLSTIYVTATKGAGSETAVDNFTNAPFTATNNVWSGGKFWPADNSNPYHFYAVNVNGGNGVPTLSVSNGNVTIAPQNANTDIVVGYIANPTFRSMNTLEMGHIFCQVGTVSMKAPAGYAVTNMRITLQPVTSGTYNLKSGQWTTRGNAGAATYILGTASSGVTVSTESNNATVTGGDNDLWMLPGDYILTASYTISKGAYSKEITGKTCSVRLQQGKNNNIGPTVQGGQDQPNIPEPDDISEITFSVTVTPWDNTHIDANF